MLVNINCSSKNTVTGFNFGNSVITIEAERYSGSSPFSATVNVKANDKININAYRTQIDTWELRLGTIGGTGCHLQCDGWLEFQGNVRFYEPTHINKLDYATGAYPTAVWNAIQELSNHAGGGGSPSNWYQYPARTNVDFSGNSLIDVSGVQFFVADISGEDISGYRANYYVDKVTHLLTYSDGYQTRPVAQDWSAFTPERDLNMMGYSLTNATSLNTSILQVDIVRAQSGHIQVQNNITMSEYSIENIDYLRTNSVYFYRTAPNYSNMSYLSMHQRSNYHLLSLDSLDFLAYDVSGGRYTFENGNRLNLYYACNAPSIVFQDAISNVGILQFKTNSFVVNRSIDLSYTDLQNVNNIYITNLESTGDPINVNAQLLCYGGVDLQNRSIENVENIQLNTINGSPYVPGGGGGGSNWYTYQAQGSVDMNFYDLNNMGTIYFNPYTSINHTNVDGVDYLNVNSLTHRFKFGTI